MNGRGRGRTVIRALVLSAVIFFSAIGALALFHPQSSLPPGWRPFEPLKVEDELGPLTAWKLGRIAADPAKCLNTLAQTTQVRVIDLGPSEDSNCIVASPVQVSAIGAIKLESPLETACSTALHLWMWGVHGLQPLASDHMRSPLVELTHLGSYSCRTINTPGGSTRLSTHATAAAVDIVSFRFADGRVITLENDWHDDGEVGRFLHKARDTACLWFGATLSPDFNSLHADHFHLQVPGWGTCR